MQLRATLPLLSLTAALMVGCNAERVGNPHDAVHIAALQEQVADQKALLAGKDATIADLQSKLNSAPASTEPDISGVRKDLAGFGDVTWRNGELVISVGSDILFSPGKATLTSKAKSGLKQVASTVSKRYSGQFIRVEGHTDSQPIRRTRKLWEDNWHLAGARARAVLHELVERGGLDRTAVSFAGYADTRGRADNKTRTGRSKNRRVEIVILPATQAE